MVAETGREQPGIVLDGGTPKVVNVADVAAEDLLVHKADQQSTVHANMLVGMSHPELPVPVGVFRAIERPVYDEELQTQIDTVTERRGKGDLQTLLNSGDTWTVE